MRNLRVVILGASGAVGSEVVSTLLAMPEVSQVTALVRKPFNVRLDAKLQQYVVDVINTESYKHLLFNHHAAICTFGVGEPSKVSREEFKAVDFDAVFAFARACEELDVAHFELLSAVAADPTSRSFYLKSKGALREAIVGLGFQRFSCFQPSMLLTQTNRYGLSQAMLLSAWPVLSRALVGGTRKYRGIQVEDLGAAMAQNLLTQGQGSEVLHWPEIMRLKYIADSC